MCADNLERLLCLLLLLPDAAEGKLTAGILAIVTARDLHPGVYQRQLSQQLNLSGRLFNGGDL